MEPTPIVVDFPLRGEWAAYHTPAERVPSHGTDQLAQRYAYDFLRIASDRNGWRFCRASTHRYQILGVPLENCYGWAAPIHAPFGGAIVAASDGWPERDPVHFLRDLAVVLMNALTVVPAGQPDVPAIVSLRASVAQQLTRVHGRGHWSSCPTEGGVLRALKTSRVFVARQGARVVGTARVEARKPWAIDPGYFVAVPKAVYLHDIAVTPEAQGRGIGRLLVEAAVAAARAWPSNAIRLDAYDHAAGAGPFYVKCGFREVGKVTYRGVPLVYFELLF